MTTKEFFFDGHPLLGRVFTMPVKTFLCVSSGSAILLMLLPSWLINVHLIPCDVGNYGFWLKPNWLPMYGVILPIIFGTMIALSKNLHDSVLKLSRPPLDVITKKPTTPASTPSYPQLLSSRLAKSATPIFIVSLVLALGILAIDTRNLWSGFAHNRFYGKVQPDWDTAYTGFAKDKYEIYCKDSPNSCKQIICSGYQPPTKTANLLFDIITYAFQGTVFFLGFFWVGKFYWFLQSFSSLMRFEDSPYQFNPLDNPQDPDTRMGLRPMGYVFNGFLVITLLFQLYIFFYRVELVRIGRPGITRWQYVESLFLHPLKMDFAFGTVTISLILLILFMNLPIAVICYFPLWTLYRYVKRRRNEAWEEHAREFANAVEKSDRKRATELNSKMNVLQRACVWPNGDTTARRFLIIMLVLAVSSVVPPLLPYSIGAGVLAEVTLANFRRDPLATRAQILQHIFIEKVENVKNQYNIEKMRDLINAEDSVVATGDNANIHDIDFSQKWKDASHEIDLGVLADELAKLQQAMKAEANHPEQYTSLSHVAAAEEEAKKENGPKTLEYLSKAGNWALEIASKITVSIATEALKKAMGL
jgi:hypothetical protein